MDSQQVQAALDGDRRALARVFTSIERSTDDLRDVMRLVHPHTGNAYCVGITGPPGAGKSTLVDGLAREARAEGRTVGILAVDPSSPFSGGAVLGDRVRMQHHYLDPEVFIRSMATRGVQGGLSRVAGAAVRLLDAVGKDLVIVETVGVGQTELDIMRVADTVVVAMVPEAGDSVQAMKAGLMEIADVFVVNKADRDGAGQLAAAIRGMLSLGQSAESSAAQVLLTQANRHEGVPELYRALWEYRATLNVDGNRASRQRGRLWQEFSDAVTERMSAALQSLMTGDGALAETARKAESGELEPNAAAADALANETLLTDLRRALSSDQDRP
ncbi:MAG TPA: methylmalonyl Co-A mutase-associated GTPase MeaB [SAR202 cluster bacterium]|nr:methylmalonyl Co-A mutase-associated GTPase MeaB [SAR202 cluster bacterium]HJO83498.1 methylmalonyl Co-A mutase-associated GTPase MeaB [SAR202 cluster bacterium]